MSNKVKMDFRKAVLVHRRTLQQWEKLHQTPMPSNEEQELIAKIVSALYLNQPHVAKPYAERLLELAKVAKKNKWIGLVFNTFALVETEKGDYRKAQLFGFQAIDILGEHHEECIITYRTFAEIFTNQGKYQQAIDYLDQSLDLQKLHKTYNYEPFTKGQIAKVKYRKGEYKEALRLCLETEQKFQNHPFLDGWQALLLQVKGLIYSAQKDYQQALSNYFEAVKMWELLENKFQMTGIYINIGSAYLSQNNIPAAERYYKRALEIDEENGGNKKIQSLIYQNLGIIHHYQSNKIKALASYEKALAISKRMNDRLGEMQTLFNMSVVFDNNVPKSIQLYEKSLKLAKEIGDSRFIFLNYSNLSELYAEIGNYKSAYNYRVLAQQKERQLFGLEKTKAIAEVENRFKQELREEALKLLQTNNEELKHFAHKAAHEIKEPLRMINSFGNILKRRYRNKLDQRGVEYLDFMLNSSKYLTDMLQDLIEYAIVGSDKKANRPIDLNEKLLAALTNLQPQIEANNVQILASPLPSVQVPPAHIIRVFQNLLDNAIKFQSNRDPIIKINTIEKASHYQISIEDNGIGIAPNNYEKIFKIFERLHAKTAYKGNGIGLAICKRIIERLKGKIWLTSELGVGTTFFFTIPK